MYFTYLSEWVVYALLKKYVRYFLVVKSSYLCIIRCANMSSKNQIMFLTIIKLDGLFVLILLFFI